MRDPWLLAVVVLLLGTSMLSGCQPALVNFQGASAPLYPDGIRAGDGTMPRAPLPPSPVINQAPCPTDSGLVLCFDTGNAAKVQQWIRDLDAAARQCH